MSVSRPIQIPERHDDIARWKGSWAIVFLWSYLLSPLFLRSIQGNPHGLGDPLQVFNAASSLLWASALHFAVRRPLYLHLGLAPLYITTVIDLFLLSTFDARFSSGYVTIALTDHAEAIEFLNSYWRDLVVPVITLVLIYGTCIWVLRGFVLVPRGRIAVGSAVLLAGMYGAIITRGIIYGESPLQSALDLAGKEQGAPFGSLFQTGLALHIHYDGARLREMRSRYRFDALQANPNDGLEVIIWVIGESARPHNWSLFGYPRDTTPLLRSRDGVVPLPNMLTTAPHTAIAVPTMLSLVPVSDWEGVKAQKSIVTAFSEAGYRTYWLSVQELMVGEG